MLIKLLLFLDWLLRGGCLAMIEHLRECERPFAGKLIHQRTLNQKFADDHLLYSELIPINLSDSPHLNISLVILPFL